MASLNTKLASAPNVSSNYVLRATSSTTIANSTIQDDGTYVGIGIAPSSSYKLNVSGTGNFTGALSGTSATFQTTVTPLVLKSTSATTMWSEYYYNTSTLSGYIGSGSGILTGANNSDFIIRSEADFVVASGGNNRRLTIASTGAATFSSSVQADFLVVGTTAASSGGLRLGTQVAIRARNVANTANIPLIESTATDAVAIASGGANVGIGWVSASYLLDARKVTSSPIANFGYSQIGASNSNGLIRVQSGTIPQGGGDFSGESGIIFAHSGGTGGVNFDANGGYIKSIRTGLHDTTSTANSALVFATTASNSNTERMRITSDGRLWVRTNASLSPGGVSGVANILNPDDNGLWALALQNNGSNNTYGRGLGVRNLADFNNAASEFIFCVGNTTPRFYVTSNGGVANYSANNVNLSDERTKKDISPLESYWDKFKDIEIVKFKYKDQTHDDFNIGVIAQQVENIAPEFVNVDGFGGEQYTPEDGIPLKSIYEADLHHATIKVLQEAMTKIEELSAKVTALENK